MSPIKHNSTQAFYWSVLWQQSLFLLKYQYPSMSLTTLFHCILIFFLTYTTNLRVVLFSFFGATYRGIQGLLLPGSLLRKHCWWFREPHEVLGIEPAVLLLCPTNPGFLRLLLNCKRYLLLLYQLMIFLEQARKKNIKLVIKV